jgi:hypothetical protein
VHTWLVGVKSYPTNKLQALIAEQRKKPELHFLDGF